MNNAAFTLSKQKVNPEHKRYIIALHVNEEKPLIEFAEKHFASVAENYLLGKDSHPHITLVQFYATEVDYAKIVYFLETITTRPKPTILGMQFGYDSKDKEVLWAGLIVKRDEPLVGLHEQLVKFLTRHNIPCLIPTNELYAPHITLARIRTNTIASSRFEPTPNFNLVIGIGDEFGQLKEITRDFPKPTLRLESTCCVIS